MLFCTFLLRPYQQKIKQDEYDYKRQKARKSICLTTRLGPRLIYEEIHSFFSSVFDYLKVVASTIKYYDIGLTRILRRIAHLGIVLQPLGGKFSKTLCPN